MTKGIGIALSGLLLLLGICANAVAEVPTSLKKDFREVSGVIIMPVAEGEFLVDLDASSGLATGDLLTIVDRGEKIIHPVTKEVMGTLDQTRAVLRVMQIKKGYSYVQTVGKALDVKRGDTVKRFSGLEARFIDYRSTGMPLYEELQQALPQLNWQGYEKAEFGKPLPATATEPGPPVLEFILGQDDLVVRDSTAEVLRSYPMPGGEAMRAVPPAPAPPSNVVVAAPVMGAVKTGQEPSAIVHEDIQATQGIWSGPLQEGKPVGLVVADLDGDGLLETALGFEDRIEIGRRTASGYASVATVKTGSRRQVVRLAYADLDGNGRTELYITGVTNERLSSLIVQFNGKSFVQTQEDLPYYFATVEFSGEGNVLLGQRMGDLRTDFRPPVFRMIAQGNTVSEGAAVPLPEQADIYGFLPFNNGEERLWALVNNDHQLVIYGQNDNVLWEGGKDYAHGETGIERDDPNSPGGSKGDKRVLYLKVGMKRGPAGEILVAVNKGFSLMSRWRMYRESMIQAFVWSGGGLREAWHTRTQDGYLADFQVADVDNDGQLEIATILGNPQTSPFSKRKASLVVYEIQ